MNPVDAKYVIGDKFPETWMEWSARRVSGHTPGFDFSGVVVRGDGKFKEGEEVRQWEDIAISEAKIRGKDRQYYAVLRSSLPVLTCHYIPFSLLLQVYGLAADPSKIAVRHMNGSFAEVRAGGRKRRLLISTIF